MASGPITLGQIDGGKMEAMADLIFLGSKITVDSDCSHKINRRLLLERKAMANLDSILKSFRDTALLTKICRVKAMVFSVVRYRCGSWTIKKAESEVKVKVAQLCLTLCDPTDYPVHGILQARILAWVAFPFSSRSFQPRD